MADECEFDLLPVEGRLAFDNATWSKAKTLSLEMQLAKSVPLIGEPATRVRVLAYGTRAEVAPAIVEMLAGLAVSHCA